MIEKTVIVHTGKVPPVEFTGVSYVDVNEHNDLEIRCDDRNYVRIYANGFWSMVDVNWEVVTDD